MGLLKKLKKLKLKHIAGVAKVALSVVPGGGLIAGGISIAEKVANKARGIADLANRVAGGAEGFATGAAPRGPPFWQDTKGGLNFGLLAVLAVAAWLLFSPNPGLLTAMFAGPVRTTVSTRRRKRKTVTTVAVKTAPKKAVPKKKAAVKRKKSKR